MFIFGCFVLALVRWESPAGRLVAQCHGFRHVAKAIGPKGFDQWRRVVVVDRGDGGEARSAEQYGMVATLSAHERCVMPQSLRFRRCVVASAAAVLIAS